MNPERPKVPSKDAEVVDLAEVRARRKADEAIEEATRLEADRERFRREFADADLDFSRLPLPDKEGENPTEPEQSPFHFTED